ncbi:serine/threonine-protein kinase [Verrucosispora sioxanthis]|uniref:serine/threonine-protein kinase n=1 Tax=Verrucosispora sioxanthis TaxID=2499994 RepID=UPI0035A0677A
MTDTPPGALPTPIVPGLTDLQVFARGGYATVYRATQISVGREVAVKVENRTLVSDRDQARFLREARAAGRMSSHPHVVDLFDVGVTIDQHPYLIMELCDGSYAERMRNSPLDAVEARDLGVKIADAIAHSHAAGVLHRDVKPANILHSHFNPAVLADFGLAVVAEMRDASVALEVLTPAYAPPEMFSHSPPSPAVDVYALCATLYAVMHGRPPRWQSERNPSLVTVLEMFHQPIPGLPGVPKALIDVLRAGMANDPADRPSAAELRDLLTNLTLDGSGAADGGASPGVAPIGGAATGGHDAGPPSVRRGWSLSPPRRASVPGRPVAGRRRSPASRPVRRQPGCSAQVAPPTPRRFPPVPSARRNWSASGRCRCVASGPRPAGCPATPGTPGRATPRGGCRPRWPTPGTTRSSPTPESGRSATRRRSAWSVGCARRLVGILRCCRRRTRTPTSPTAAWPGGA